MQRECADNHCVQRRTAEWNGTAGRLRSICVLDGMTMLDSSIRSRFALSPSPVVHSHRSQRTPGLCLALWHQKAGHELLPIDPFSQRGTSERDVTDITKIDVVVHQGGMSRGMIAILN